MEWSSSISLNSLNRSDSVVETKKEFKIYPSSVKSGHVWSFLQAGKIDPSHPLEISRFCPITGEKNLDFSSVYHHKPFINKAWQVKMSRFYIFYFISFTLKNTKKKKKKKLRT